MVELTVTERMEGAIGQLAARYPHRCAKAFYLGPDDWADFMATDPPIIEASWNCLPSSEPSFMDVPVRPSKNVAPRQSRLYDSSGQGRDIDTVIKQDGRSVQSANSREALAQARRLKLGKKQELSGPELVASLGENEGWLTWSSSPHVMWLGAQLAKQRGQPAGQPLQSAN